MSRDNSYGTHGRFIPLLLANFILKIFLFLMLVIQLAFLRPYQNDSHPIISCNESLFWSSRQWERGFRSPKWWWGWLQCHNCCRKHIWPGWRWQCCTTEISAVIGSDLQHLTYAKGLFAPGPSQEISWSPSSFCFHTSQSLSLVTQNRSSPTSLCESSPEEKEDSTKWFLSKTISTTLKLFSE